MTPVNEVKIEVLKVWYSVFCTLCDAYADGEYTALQFVAKMGDLRKKLIEHVPEVEAEMRKHKQ